MNNSLACGSWPSSITAVQVSQQQQQPREIVTEGETLYWLESRPEEDGRTIVMRCLSNGEVEEVLPSPFDCRSRVHGYGGGAYTVFRENVYFSHYADNQVYCLNLNTSAPPICLTTDNTMKYFASLCFDAHRNRLLAVCEDHSGAGEPENYIVCISVGDEVRVEPIVAGKDFYAEPSISPNGEQLCWLSWSHPNMPWDSSLLWLATLNDDGLPGDTIQIAGGPEESICQPSFSPAGELYFISDASGWWNIYRWSENQVVPVVTSKTDFAAPQRVFGQANYAFIDEQTLLAAHCVDGQWQLVRVLRDKQVKEAVESTYVQISHVRASPKFCFFIAAANDRPLEVIRLNTTNNAIARVCDQASTSPSLDTISRAETIAFNSTGGRRAHGFYYPPTHPQYTRRLDELPPLLVIAHGGPTGAASSAFDPMVQFWTSRGFAVLAVNYCGSANYGRAYRRELYGNWGIADTQDCIAGALYLVSLGLVDGDRLAIRGNSAGGYTVLSALTFHDVFAAGASYYGISDLKMLTQDTHKFESRYLDSLIGPWPEQQEIYTERSALHHCDAISAPLILLQGLLDKVVPPGQTSAIACALKKRSIPVAEVYFPEEGHGFRCADNIVTALNAELQFYGRVFKFQPADMLTPDIDALRPSL